VYPLLKALCYLEKRYQNPFLLRRMPVNPLERDITIDVVTSLVRQYEPLYANSYPYVLGRITALLTPEQWKEISTWLRDDNGLQEE